ncbi:hypothetical protein [Kitasatospora sp. NPDC097643]|uniref:hypothetical protein n=1 Tax=Kitasatospora sp. NPDC097643 TaxID=3157230 RepID=UPI00331E785D
MHLVHAALRPPFAGAELPPGVPEFIRTTADPREPVEHVSVHRRADSTTVLGLFLVADRLADAERRAAEACRRAVATMPALDGWTVTRAEAPLIAPVHERLLSASGLGGRNWPGPNPSSRQPFRHL